jgi:transposase
MPATVIGERIGWTRSIRTLSGRVAELRPAYLPPDPASCTSCVAGEIAQCDLWFPPVVLPVGFGQDRAAAGADHDRWSVAVAVGGADSLAAVRGLVRRVAADRGLAVLAEGAVLGW